MADDYNDTASDARDGTIELVSAYVSNSNTRVNADEFQALIRETFATLSSLTAAPEPEPVEQPEAQTKSKADIRKSIRPDGLVSFIDGKTYKTLKRHLGTKGYTPESYRTQFGLGADYPMVAPDYSAARSRMAKDIGLGAKGRKARDDAGASTADAPKAKRRSAKAAAE